MRTRNIDGLSPTERLAVGENGGRFIYYNYTVSLLFLTFKRESEIYIVKAGENAANKSFIYTLVTALFGWWGFPFGPKHTWKALRRNLEGGNDVTDEVLSTAEGYLLFEEAQLRKKAS